MTTRKMIIVGCAAFLFRLLYILWGLTDWYLIPLNTMSKEYLYQGYAICGGYGYISEAWGKIPFENMDKLKKLADQGVRITP